jgi:hypothetical protein
VAWLLGGGVEGSEPFGVSPRPVACSSMPPDMAKQVVALATASVRAEYTEKVSGFLRWGRWGGNGLGVQDMAAAIRAGMKELHPADT